MKANKILAIILLFSSFHLNAQFYEGAGNNIGSVGYKLSNFKYLAAGFDYGYADFLSIGLGIEYPLEGLLNAPLNIELRAEFHGGYIMDLKKSDILFGYQFEIKGSHGVHATYQYAFGDTFGVFGRTNFYFVHPEKSDFNIDDKNLNFEFGVIFRSFGFW